MSRSYIGYIAELFGDVKYRIASHRMRLNLRELDGSRDPVKAGFRGFERLGLIRQERRCSVMVVMPAKAGHLWCEPINLEWSADVRFGARINGLKSDIAPCPKSARLGHRPVYSITPSASASSGDGTRIPSVLAVFKLMNNSNLDACITGRSAAFSPLRILPAYTPACRYISLMLAP
jgi:hypothetical protein